jgi:predicted branched-subunit amino acid permease
MAPRPYPGALRAAIPLFVPAMPFALVLGVAITESVMPTTIGWSTNLLIFAGAAQLATVTLAATATWLTLVATAVTINLRHAMYSAALVPRFTAQPRWFRWAGPMLLIDQTFVLVSARDDLGDDDWRHFYLSCGIFFMASWTAMVTLGLVIGSSIPTEWRLDAAPAIMFGGLVVLGATSTPAIVAAVTGAAVCFACLSIPNNGGILVGALAGVTAGFVAERDVRAGGPAADAARGTTGTPS